LVQLFWTPWMPYHECLRFKTGLNPH